MRCLAKYSCPLPLSPNKLERQLKNTLGKFRGSFGFSIAQSISPSFILETTSSITSCSSFAPCSLLSLTMSMERSEEHTSELQSRGHLVCRLLLEKKNA